MSMHESEALGVDIGGVIIDRVSEDDQSYAGAAAVEGAFEAIARLVQRRFREHVWLVSRCEESRELVLVAWLEQHDFFGSTGVSRHHVRFCRQHHDKATICRQLGVTHFIDDRLEVLSHLVGTVPHLYLLQSRAGGMDQFRQFLPLDFGHFPRNQITHGHDLPYIGGEFRRFSCTSPQAVACHAP